MPDAALSDGYDPQRIGDVRQRVAVDDDEIGELAFLECPDLLLEA